MVPFTSPLLPPAGNPWSSSHICLPAKPFRRKWNNSLQRCQTQLRAAWSLTRIPLHTHVQNPPVRDQTVGKAGITEMPGLASFQPLGQPSVSCSKQMRCLLSSSYSLLYLLLFKSLDLVSASQTLLLWQWESSCFQELAESPANLELESFYYLHIYVIIIRFIYNICLLNVHIIKYILLWLYQQSLLSRLCYASCVTTEDADNLKSALLAHQSFNSYNKTISTSFHLNFNVIIGSK